MIQINRPPRPTRHALPQSMPDEVLRGLSAIPKTLPSKYFYDAAGSRFFERICQLPEYYLTRTELSILRDNLNDIAAHAGPHATLIEYGSGSSLKTRLLLSALDRPAGYVPIDISPSALGNAVAALKRQFTRLPIHPICADYTCPIEMEHAPPGRRRVIFFPGSTIGNFDPPQAAEFLHQARELAGNAGAMIIGVDLRKPPAILHAAYNDTAGITAEFNRNLLHRLNRELHADFQPRLFDHYAFYNPAHGRIEMHLLSRRRQRVRVAGRSFRLERGETIHTESSYKYTPASFHTLATRAGWQPQKLWTDPHRRFAVFHMVGRQDRA